MTRLTTILVITSMLLTACGEKTPPVSEPLVVSATVIEEPVTEFMEVAEPEPEPELIEYRVTAYCPCEICCGEWANKRPVDEFGNPIVYGASGAELVTNYSVASPLPFGTKIELDGFGVVEVQDRTAQWVVDKFGENIIDIYMTNHEEAREFALQYIVGEVLE